MKEEKENIVAKEKESSTSEFCVRTEADCQRESVQSSFSAKESDGITEPHFTQRLQDLEVVEGSAARFEVVVKGLLNDNLTSKCIT